MRWNVERPKEPKEPKDGDTRSIRKFAWRKTIIDHECVWLETYLQHQVYRKSFVKKGGHWDDWKKSILMVVY